MRDPVEILITKFMVEPNRLEMALPSHSSHFALKQFDIFV